MHSSKTDRIIQALMGVLLVALVVVIYQSFHERVVNVGDSAPDFTVKTDTGRTVSTSDFGGKLLVLNFWATWCVPCIQEMPSLNEFQRATSDSGVVVLGVNVDKDERAYRDFLSKAKVSFLTARDPSNKINADYGTFKFPETYVIDAKGNVVRKYIGPEDWTSERMVSDIRSLL
jgi:peroxiredoxin